MCQENLSKSGSSPADSQRKDMSSSGCEVPPPNVEAPDDFRAALTHSCTALEPSLGIPIVHIVDRELSEKLRNGTKTVERSPSIYGFF